MESVCVSCDRGSWFSREALVTGSCLSESMLTHTQINKSQLDFGRDTNLPSLCLIHVRGKWTKPLSPSTRLLIQPVLKWYSACVCVWSRQASMCLPSLCWSRPELHLSVRPLPNVHHAEGQLTVHSIRLWPADTQACCSTVWAFVQWLQHLLSHPATRSPSNTHTSRLKFWVIWWPSLFIQPCEDDGTKAINLNALLNLNLLEDDIWTCRPGHNDSNTVS